MLMKRSFELCALALCLTALLLAACDKLGGGGADAGQATVEGDTLLLPPESQYLAYERAVPSERPFKQFNDRYPAAWPVQVRFPPGVYLQGSPSMEIKSTGNGDSKGKFTGAAKMTAKKFAEMLRNQFVAAGWEMSEIKLVPGNGAGGVTYPDELVYFGSFKRTKFDKRSSYVVIKVPAYSGMGGWCLFNIEFEYKTIS